MAVNVENCLYYLDKKTEFAKTVSPSSLIVSLEGAMHIPHLWSLQLSFKIRDHGICLTSIDSSSLCRVEKEQMLQGDAAMRDSFQEFCLELIPAEQTQRDHHASHQHLIS